MKELIERMAAAGLKPVLIDEDTDFDELPDLLGMTRDDSVKRETNEDFIRRVMNFGCPTGALIQPFMIEALGYYCDEVLASDGENWPQHAPVSFQAWQTTARWLKADLEKKYGA